MEGKKTSVDWIESWIVNIDVKFYSKEFILRILKEAKLMNKEQIEEAFDKGKWDSMAFKGTPKEQYYNETYGK